MSMFKVLSALILGIVLIAQSSTLPSFAHADSSDTASTSASSNSANWAGYTATEGSFTEVGGSWVVPSPSAVADAHLSADATWVGIGGVSSHDLIQAGTQAVIHNGSVIYEAWYELLPDSQTIVPLDVHAGDSITARITELNPDVWEINIMNTTTGKRYDTNVVYPSSHSSADWIEEMPIGTNGFGSHFLPLDNFGSIGFTNAYAISNGVRSTPSQLGAKSITMLTRAGDTLAAPSILAGDGASFSISRTSASPLVAAAAEPLPTVRYRSRSYRIHIPSFDVAPIPVIVHLITNPSDPSSSISITLFQ